MKKYTQKHLREMVRDGIARDISYYDNWGRNQIQEKEGYYTQVGYASGKYGCSGMLLKGHRTGSLYAVTSRTSAIYIF